MPIYEYQCDGCGHRLEKLQKVSDDPLRDCPACERSGLQKLVSAAAFRLKGGGWYETDFKTGKKRNVSGADADGGGSSSDAAKPAAVADSSKPSDSPKPSKPSSASSTSDGSSSNSPAAAAG